MNVKDYYERNFHRAIKQEEGYEQHSHWTKKALELIAEKYPSVKGLRILDVGPEIGKYLLLYKQAGADVHVIDLSEEVVNYHIKKHGFKGEAVDITSVKSKYPDNHFDIVIMTEVIEHMFDGQKALDEIYRLLKVGGRLFVSTHNTMNGFMRLKYLMGKVPNPLLDVSNQKTKGGHIRIFNTHVLRKMIDNAGFKDIEDRSFMSQFNGHEPILKSLLSQHLFFVAKKTSKKSIWTCRKCGKNNSNETSPMICTQCKSHKGE